MKRRRRLCGNKDGEGDETREQKVMVRNRGGRCSFGAGPDVAGSGPMEGRSALAVRCCIPRRDGAMVA
jgi:hypothetical protein